MTIPKGTMPSALFADARQQAHMVKVQCDRLQWFTVVDDKVDWQKSVPYAIEKDSIDVMTLLTHRPYGTQVWFSVSYSVFCVF